MSTEKRIDFARLSPAEIRAQDPRYWSDEELADIAYDFIEEDDPERFMAVLELMLRSPDHSELLVYHEIYQDLVREKASLGDYAGALRWHYAYLAYLLLHPPILNLDSAYWELAELYIEADDVNTGLRITTRYLRMNPADVFVYNMLGFALAEKGFGRLAYEALEKALKLVEREDLQNMKEQLQSRQREVKAQMAKEADITGQLDPDAVAEFRQALQLEKGHPNGLNAYLPPVDALITADEKEYEAERDRILAQGRVLAVDLLRLAFDEAWRESPAAERATALLRELHASGMSELDELSVWLEQTKGDWRALMSKYVGKTRGFTTSELEALASNTEYDISLRINAIEALAERSQKQREERERIIQIFRHLLNRPEAKELVEEETLAGHIAAVVDETDLVELYPDIKAAFDEDRVDPQITDLAFLEEKWGLPHTSPPPEPVDGFKLLLKCTQCGRQRYHTAKHVTIDTPTLERLRAGEPVEYPPAIMDHEIVCPKCGAREQYEISPLSLSALLMPQDVKDALAQLVDEKEFSPASRPGEVHIVRSVAFDQEMHPLAAIAEYKRLIAQEPLNAQIYVPLSNIYRSLYRHQDALNALRKAHALAPNDPVVMLHRAFAEHDFGDKKIARRLYLQTREALKSRLADQETRAMRLVVKTGLKALEKGDPSPWGINIIESASKGKKSRPRSTRGGVSRKKVSQKKKRKKRRR